MHMLLIIKTLLIFFLTVQYPVLQTLWAVNVFRIILGCYLNPASITLCSTVRWSCFSNGLFVFQVIWRFVTLKMLLLIATGVPLKQLLFDN